MVDNIYKFRRIKWGDPEQKLRLLPPRPRGFDYFPLTVMFVFVVVFVGTLAGLRILV